MTTHAPRERNPFALRFEDLGKRYTQGTWGLRHASAELQQGKLIAVLGPNGAGKSTLIHMLAQAIQPTEGRIDLFRPDTRVGWASQRTTIDWYLNAMENVMLGARLNGLSRRESRKRALELLETLHLADHATADVSMLSGGQQQRLQVARTLISDPDILLLDEPTASLDIDAAEAVLGHLKHRAQRGALVLISSHDLGLLEQACDEVMLIHGGTLVAHQPLQAFLRMFTPAQALTVRIEGDLPPSVIDLLWPYDPKLQEPNRITLTLPEGMLLGEVITILEQYVRVVDASRETASLRSVYRQVTAQEGGCS